MTALNRGLTSLGNYAVGKILAGMTWLDVLTSAQLLRIRVLQALLTVSTDYFT